MCLNCRLGLHLSSRVDFVVMRMIACLRSVRSNDLLADQSVNWAGNQKRSNLRRGRILPAYLEFKYISFLDFQLPVERDFSNDAREGPEV